MHQSRETGLTILSCRHRVSFGGILTLCTYFSNTRKASASPY